MIVRFAYGLADLGPLHTLEDALQPAVGAAGAGEYDGHEIATDLSHGFLYLYGPDADRLLEAARPCLHACAFTRGATVTLRYGPAGGQGVRETECRLDP